MRAFPGVAEACFTNWGGANLSQARATHHVCLYITICLAQASNHSRQFLEGFSGTGNQTAVAGVGADRSMGSSGMFSRCACPTCGDESFGNTIWSRCIQCKNAVVASTKGCVWMMPLRNKLSPGITDRVVSYLLPSGDVYADFTRKYLRVMLLGPPSHPSQFRRLTYGANGMAGNISQCEDVIDRVLEFVCGVDCTCEY